MRQKGCFAVALFVIFFSYQTLFAKDLTQSRLHELSQSRYWHVLLHMKNGRSEIDDPSFFLTSPSGFSPENELEETIAQIEDENQSISCKYPARIYWLKQVAPELFDKEQFVCEKLEKRIAKEHIQGVTLVFPTAYLNSPASMFGHTFLRLDKNPDTPLISEAVNYAAQTDETNGLIYTFKGLTGGYKGFFSVLRYYKKIKEYSAMEQRDMWEYRLKLSYEEIRRLLYHLYELQGVYGNYYFFTKNCSYNLLWLLESAKGDTYLPEHFTYKVIPVDTIRLLHEKKLIAKTFFRSSKRREMQQLVKLIKNRTIAKKFTETYELKLLENVNDHEKAKVLDLAVLILKQRRSKKKINKKEYIQTLMKLLRYRSKLPQKESLKIPEPANPLLGHKSARAAVWISEKGKWSLQFKPAMHDLYDITRGYLPGAYIDFFKLTVERSKFQRFDFVSVRSLADWDRFFKPFSWKAEISVTRVHGKRLCVALQGGVGASVRQNGLQFYLLGTPQLYLGKEGKSAVGIESGLMYDNASVRTGVLYRKDFFDDGIRESRAEWFLTWQTAKAWALNLKLHEDKIAQKRTTDLDVGLFYYF